jgi:hypothetical protein
VTASTLVRVASSTCFPPAGILPGALVSLPVRDRLPRRNLRSARQLFWAPPLLHRLRPRDRKRQPIAAAYAFRLPSRAPPRSSTHSVLRPRAVAPLVTIKCSSAIDQKAVRKSTSPMFPTPPESQTELWPSSRNFADVPNARAANNLSKFPEPGLGQPVVTLEVGAARDQWYASLVPRAWHRPQLKYIRTDWCFTRGGDAMARNTMDFARQNTEQATDWCARSQSRIAIRARPLSRVY